MNKEDIWDMTVYPLQKTQSPLEHRAFAEFVAIKNWKNVTHYNIYCK